MKNLEKFEAMHREVETLGEENNYHGQARAFLAGTETTLEARFLGMEAGQFGPDDTDNRDRYEIRISRDGRSFTFTYGNSYQDTEDRLQKIAGVTSDYGGDYLRRNPEAIKNSLSRAIRFQKWEKRAREWVKLETPEAKELHMPDAYSILCSVEKYEPETDIDSFASSFGIEKPSEAIRIHKAVTEGYNNMRALYDNDELETLSLIA